MKVSKNELEKILLDWTKLKYKALVNKKNKRKLIKKIERIEEHLAAHNIKDIEIIYKSPDYYTLRYLKKGETRIKQFLTSHVEE